MRWLIAAAGFTGWDVVNDAIEEDGSMRTSPWPVVILYWRPSAFDAYSETPCARDRDTRPGGHHVFKREHL